MTNRGPRTGWARYAPACAREAIALRETDAGASLAVLIRGARGEAATGLLRRAALIWTRQTAGRLETADQAAQQAENVAARTRTDDAARGFAAAVGDWAALTAPERLVDAAAGLDHDPSVARARRWRGLADRLAQGGAEPLALVVVDALVEAFNDLPGMAAVLRRDRDGHAAVIRDRAHAAVFAPLQELVARFTAEPGPLVSALVGYAGFGPLALAEAEDLWTAFTKVRAVAPGSRRPFDLLSELATRLGQHGSSAAELSLIQGLIVAVQTDATPASLAEVLADLQGGSGPCCAARGWRGCRRTPPAGPTPRGG